MQRTNDSNNGVSTQQSNWRELPKGKISDVFTNAYKTCFIFFKVGANVFLTFDNRFGIPIPGPFVDPVKADKMMKDELSDECYRSLQRTKFGTAGDILGAIAADVIVSAMFGVVVYSTYQILRDPDLVNRSMGHLLRK